MIDFNWRLVQILSSFPTPLNTRVCPGCRNTEASWPSRRSPAIWSLLAEAFSGLPFCISLLCHHVFASLEQNIRSHSLRWAGPRRRTLLREEEGPRQRPTWLLWQWWFMHNYYYFLKDTQRQGRIKVREHTVWGFCPSRSMIWAYCICEGDEQF